VEIGASRALFISPYNVPNGHRGQATIGRASSTASYPARVTVIAPVGGGGLLSGAMPMGTITLARAHRRRRVKRVAVECPPQSPRADRPRAVARPSQTGLAANLEPGSITPGLVAAAQLVAR